jgi:hypothetical protein
VKVWLVMLGFALVALGLAWPLIEKLGLGRLPGDFRVEREGFSFYFPLTSSILVSLVVSLALWLILWLLRR